MSDTNSPGLPGDSGDAAWPEYLTGGGHPAVPAEGGGPAAGTGTPEGAAAPHRVIGTPSPAAGHVMLAPQEQGAQPPEPWLPPGPDDPVRAKKAERVVAACFLLAMLAGFGFIASYVIFGAGTITRVQHSNLALGTCLGLALLLLGAGAVIWVRHVMPDVELTEQRHVLASDPKEKAEFVEVFNEGADASGFKRPLLRRTLIAATVPLGLAPLLLLRDTGPLPGTSLDHTVWRKGLRLLVYGTNRPITPAEFSSPGAIMSVVPEGYQDDDDALAKAAVVIIKFRPNELQFTSANHPVPNKVVQNWTVNDIVAYSKICTHVGCPAALYDQTTHHILCPCHQSTFEATQGARVIFGPATRPLPQLPMGVDAQGYLVATSDFTVPVGPSFWERS